MRRFLLVRDVDITGISGIGTVAEGVQYTDGVVALRWLGPVHHEWGVIMPTIVIHPSIGNVEVLHGHQGSTRIEWVDGPRGSDG